MQFDSHPQDMLRRRDPEDPFHASLQLRLTEPSRTGEIGNLNRLTEVILDVPHDLTQTPGPDVGIDDDQIVAHRNRPTKERSAPPP